MEHQVTAECEVARGPEGPDGATRDGILVLDSESAVVVETNPFLTEILGYSREELLGRTLRGIGVLGYSVHGDTLLGKVRREGYVRCTSLRLKTRDGRCVLADFVGNAYRVDDRTVVQLNVGKVRECPMLKRGDGGRAGTGPLGTGPRGSVVSTDICA